MESSSATPRLCDTTQSDYHKFEWKPLRSFSENDIKLLHLDYDSQNDPQLIMKEYLSTKNFDLLIAGGRSIIKQA